ncbi:DHHA1 domain-containing protein [Clostridium chauvoei]|uniref:Alanine--tRNA ligase n=2 Tax=Clostridium chauvoei TaxID=46867 RepID=S6F171_9CLOT|nr:DHHA1 domain-containing protein [Clostridium chauvoei]ATD55620.1 alanyl-tRNA editing protein AlaX-L [Clostridium chauvoei]ATD56703.1 alanyl-tRNA editing protein AlaX-L [Clostridium chauvoei]MBX7280143.1 alanyl-tRNA editing protein AlaX-L [Clostridium chauvoei]MBX7282627.1 alanyl-tRNA editing protein AlaX-L [Clostridium chauvoei]MBX7285034.1 alanyl-tRNA editing protein AlaX-L [Clostridium chauvoei]
MDRLYYTDQYIKSFTAEITNIKELDGKFHVVLDKSAFFPGGGGQSGDTGFIENHKVIDVYEEGGTLYHVVETKPIKIHKVKCSIDWEKREDGMHQHFAQHVLSGCFFNLFNANTVSVHFGKEISTIDIEGYLEEDKIRKAEALANDIIGENIEVEFLTPTKKELKKMNLRRDLPNTNEEIRIVKIGDLDINACCGVHPKSTLDLRMIKIKKWEKHKKATRIEFLAGKRAINDSIKKDKFALEICKYLSSNEEEAINGIKNLNIKLKETLDEKRKIEEEIARYQMKEMIEEADKIKSISVVRKIYDGENIKYLQKLTSKIVENENTIALMVVKNDERANLIFAASKDIKNISMNDLLKDAITLIDGKGGGSSSLAQGAGKNNSNLEMALDYAFNKLKNA